MKERAILRALLQEAKRQGLTPQAFKAKTDIPYACAWRILNGKARRATLESMCLLADAVGCSLVIFQPLVKR